MISLSILYFKKNWLMCLSQQCWFEGEEIIYSLLDEILSKLLYVLLFFLKYFVYIYRCLKIVFIKKHSISNIIHCRENTFSIPHTCHKFIELEISEKIDEDTFNVMFCFLLIFINDTWNKVLLTVWPSERPKITTINIWPSKKSALV